MSILILVWLTSMTPRRASRNFVKIPIDKKDVVRNIATSQIKIKSFRKWHFFSNFDGMVGIHIAIIRKILVSTYCNSVLSGSVSFWSSFWPYQILHGQSRRIAIKLSDKETLERFSLYPEHLVAFHRSGVHLSSSKVAEYLWHILCWIAVWYLQSNCIAKMHK